VNYLNTVPVPISSWDIGTPMSSNGKKKTKNNTKMAPGNCQSYPADIKSSQHAFAALLLPAPVLQQQNAKIKSTCQDFF